MALVGVQGWGECPPLMWAVANLPHTLEVLCSGLRSPAGARGAVAGCAARPGAWGVGGAARAGRAGVGGGSAGQEGRGRWARAGAGAG